LGAHRNLITGHEGPQWNPPAESSFRTTHLKPFEKSLLMNTPSVSRRDVLRAAVAIAAGSVCPWPRAFATGLSARERASGERSLSTNCDTPDLDPDCLTFMEDQVAVDLAKAPELAIPGHAANLIDRERSVGLIVVHVEAGIYCALSRFCTHAGRTLAYVRTRKLLQCTNFNHSLFELNGHVRKGPAELPLASHSVRLRAGILEIDLKPEVGP
jgi:nitrite reductase/ring-hydroxylating ferredoxin subunit